MDAAQGESLRSSTEHRNFSSVLIAEERPVAAVNSQDVQTMTDQVENARKSV